MAMELDSLEELDGVARLQGDDRLLGARPPAHRTAHALELAAHDHGVDVGDLDVEQLLDRVLDLDLVGVLGHLEDDLLGVGRGLALLGRLHGAVATAGLAQLGRLLGEQRAADDGLGGAHASYLLSLRACSTALAEAAVISRVSWLSTS